MQKCTIFHYIKTKVFQSTFLLDNIFCFFLVKKYLLCTAFLWSSPGNKNDVNFWLEKYYENVKYILSFFQPPFSGGKVVIANPGFFYSFFVLKSGLEICFDFSIQFFCMKKVKKKADLFQLFSSWKMRTEVSVSLCEKMKKNMDFFNWNNLIKEISDKPRLFLPNKK